MKYSDKEVNEIVELIDLNELDRIRSINNGINRNELETIIQEAYESSELTKGEASFLIEKAEKSLIENQSRFSFYGKLKNGISKLWYNAFTAQMPIEQKNVKAKYSTNFSQIFISSALFYSGVLSIIPQIDVNSLIMGPALGIIDLIIRDQYFHEERQKEYQEYIQVVRSLIEKLSYENRISRKEEFLLEQKLLEAEKINQFCDIHKEITQYGSDIPSIEEEFSDYKYMYYSKESKKINLIIPGIIPLEIFNSTINLMYNLFQYTYKLLKGNNKITDRTSK